MRDVYLGEKVKPSLGNLPSSISGRILELTNQTVVETRTLLPSNTRETKEECEFFFNGLVARSSLVMDGPLSMFKIDVWNLVVNLDHIF